MNRIIYTAACMLAIVAAFQANAASENSDVSVIRQVEPTYPTKALIECIGGTVKLEFTVTPDGKATDITVMESNADGLFDSYAIDAIRQWEFKPRIVDGIPVSRRATLPVEFLEPKNCEDYPAHDITEFSVLVAMGFFVLFELFMTMRWNKTLWIFGLPLFRTSRKLPFGKALPDTEALNTMSQKGLGWGPKYVFHLFSDGSIAFRESFSLRLLGFSYTPLMRGRIIFNPYASEIEITGIAYNWVALFFAFTLSSGIAIIIFVNHDLTSILFVVFILATATSLWMIQAHRFRKIADRVRMLIEAGTTEQAGFTRGF